MRLQLKPIENWKQCGEKERMKNLLNYLAYVVNLGLGCVLVYVLLANLAKGDWGVTIAAFWMANVCVEAVYFRMKYNALEAKVERS